MKSSSCVFSRAFLCGFLEEIGLKNRTADSGKIRKLLQWQVEHSCSWNPTRSDRNNETSCTRLFIAAKSNLINICREAETMDVGVGLLVLGMEREIEEDHLSESQMLSPEQLVEIAKRESMVSLDTQHRCQAWSPSSLVFAQALQGAVTVLFKQGSELL